ncbi:MAG: ATP-binding protein [Candidatus Omnitrophica bacterium]|nr:ATP-binding protein [Candidatus Omnitrophota bacterium]
MVKNVIPTNSRLLKKISKKLIKLLKKAEIDEEIIFDIHVSLEEALRNAMMHGNKLDIRKKIMVEAELEPSIMKIAVEDEGGGFNPSKLPDPTHSENLLKENGRGIYLMRHLMDEVKFENSGRRVTMTKYLGTKQL